MRKIAKVIIWFFTIDIVILFNIFKYTFIGFIWFFKMLLMGFIIFFGLMAALVGIAISPKGKCGCKNSIMHM